MAPGYWRRNDMPTDKERILDFPQAGRDADFPTDPSAVRENRPDPPATGASPLRAIPVRTEDILMLAEAELLRKADQGVLPCPHCGRPLQGRLRITEVYQGLVLFCADIEGCGYYEY